MSGFFDTIFTYTVTSGTTGMFTVAPQDSMINGTFDGASITGLNATYSGPVNQLAAGPSCPADFCSSGFERSTASGANGLSFNLSNGLSANIALATASTGSPLVYQESNGVSGPITLNYMTVVNEYGCFVHGVLIKTPTGETPVETLKRGDLVTTASGTARRVEWVGRTTLHPNACDVPADVLPVCVCAHAFAPDQPSRDLRLSPGHGIYVSGVLVNASELINGGTIFQEAAEKVIYYHVELADHDAIVANGLPCESYLDDGNRVGFEGSSIYNLLNMRIGCESRRSTFAPRIRNASALAKIRQKLLDQALLMDWGLVEQPQLKLEVEGLRLGPVVSIGNRYWFVLPQGAREVSLLSTAVRLQVFQPSIHDERRLGVAIDELRVNGLSIPLSDDCFGAGFYTVEQSNGADWRWTAGRGCLKLDYDARMIEVNLSAIAPVLTRTQTAVERQVAQAA